LLGEVLSAYSIRLAQAGDAPRLPAIERSAGAVFRTLPDLAWIADDKVQDVDCHLAFIAKGSAWVAVNRADEPVAFLNGEAMGGGFHIWEMSVHTDHQRCGLGARLLAAAEQFARQAGFSGLTLTTFRGVDWNQAFYERYGFAVVAADKMPAHLAEILQDESAAGLPTDRRCAMDKRWSDTGS
jgi:GNAT superfamily N-acetyltransferase